MMTDTQLLTLDNNSQLTAGLPAASPAGSRHDDANGDQTRKNTLREKERVGESVCTCVSAAALVVMRHQSVECTDGNLPVLTQ